MNELAKVKSEQRRQQLYRCGLSRYEDVLWAMDRILNELSPRPEGETRGSLRERLTQQLERLRSEGGPVQLSVKPHPDRRGALLAGLLLPSEALVEHFGALDGDAEAEDPLGVRTLYATLNYYGIDELWILDRRRRHRLRLRLDRYERDFRFSNGASAELRRLIDRALFGGEVIELTDELADSFRRMALRRRQSLAAKGLVMRTDHQGRGYRLWVPEAFRRRSATLGAEVLNTLVFMIQRRLEESLVDSRGQLFCRFHRHNSAASFEQHEADEIALSPLGRGEGSDDGTGVVEVAGGAVNLVELIVQQALWQSPALIERLNCLDITWSTPDPDSDPTQWIELEFSQPQAVIARETSHYEPPLGAKEGLVGAEESIEQTAIVDFRVPISLRCLANHVLLTQQPQPIPEESRYDDWLAQPQIQHWLLCQGLQAEVGTASDGLRQRPVRLRPRNLG